LYHKIHSIQGQTVLAACDKKLVGRTLKKGKINFFVSPNFYKGALIEAKELEQLLQECSSANLVGEKTVGIALKLGLASEKEVIRINNIPHIQVYKV